MSRGPLPFTIARRQMASSAAPGSLASRISLRTAVRVLGLGMAAGTAGTVYIFRDGRLTSMFPRPPAPAVTAAQLPTGPRVVDPETGAVVTLPVHTITPSDGAGPPLPSKGDGGAAAAAGAGGATTTSHGSATEEYLSEENKRLRALLAEQHDKAEQLSQALEALQKDMRVRNAKDARPDPELMKLREQVRILQAQIQGLKSSTPSTKMEAWRQKSTVEMYSEVLDMLERNVKYRVFENLPRVVVVGDQSAGKTSVLEMVVEAHIFPRGSGEMTTRAPVQVTLSEGPNHEADFQSRTYSLSNAGQIAELRKALAKAMDASVKTGESVSPVPISLVVRGPTMRRMVLVDLPGVVGNTERGLASNTQSKILEMCNAHMHNKNAIILCVQDGSVDSARSNVVDAVRTADPDGQRTFVVLTKMDLAERAKISQHTITELMTGKKLNLQAQGYFATVTGTASVDDSIAAIKAHEQAFFAKTTLFEHGLESQLTSDALVAAVSRKFWDNVHASVVAQADDIKQSLDLLQSEWWTRYEGNPIRTSLQILRDAESSIVPHLAAVARIPADQWEAAIRKTAEKEHLNRMVRKLYLDKLVKEAHGKWDFAAQADESLRRMLRPSLVAEFVEAGRQTFLVRVATHMDHWSLPAYPDSSLTFGPLVQQLKGHLNTTHTWRVSPAIGDILASVVKEPDPLHGQPSKWQAATQYMETALKGELEAVRGEERAAAAVKRTRADQQAFAMLEREITILTAKKAGPDLTPKLTPEESTALRAKALERSPGAKVDDALISSIYERAYRKLIIKRSIDSAKVCAQRRDFEGATPNGLSCTDVVFFHRVKEMVAQTAATLRKQIQIEETKKLQDEAGRFLNTAIRSAQTQNPVVAKPDATTSSTPPAYRALLAGPRVDLADKIELTEAVHAKLTAFLERLREESL